MRDTFSRFYYKVIPEGLVITPVNERLSAGCWNDEEIDFAIARLKEELDDLAIVMKEAAPKEAAKPIFSEESDA